MNKICYNCYLIHTENYAYCQKCGSFLVDIEEHKKKTEKLI